MVRRHSYQSMEDAPKDGRAIIGVCGGVEACICWHDPLPGVLEPGWFHWDDDEMLPSHERVRNTVTAWRKLF